jgi:ATP-binding protein involved in chromosome partitioning
VANPLEGRVVAALAAIRNPRLDNDLLSAGMVRDLRVTDGGAVSFTFLLSPDDPATLVRQARAAVQAVDGVRRDEIKITVTNPTGPARVTHGPPPTPAGVAAPAATVPAGQPNLGRILAVSSGKGGVGKSTVAVNLAVALAQDGARVGVMDADIYGPNIPRMFGVFEKPPVVEGKIQPLEAYGVKLMSLGFLVERDAPAIWRGPIIMKIVTQFLRDVNWGELDYFIVDLPPGTGDAQLSLSQLLPITGAVMVTAPQEVSVIDVEKALGMWTRVEVPVLGLIENMSGFLCPSCGHHEEIFLRGGGRRLAERAGIPFLGEIPLQAAISRAGDDGTPIVVRDPGSKVAEIFAGLASTVACALSVRNGPAQGGGKRSSKLALIR